MGDKNLYALAMGKFAIEFEVDEQASIELTKKLEPSNSDFAFVVGEIWLNTSTSRRLIVPANNPANLHEELRDLASRVVNPPSVPGLERQIPRGGWCSWMTGYWSRFNRDCPNPDDESIYDLLMPLCWSESREGFIVIYGYDDLPTVEVATRGSEEPDQLFVWSGFDSQTTALALKDIRQAMAAKVMRRR